MSGTKLTDKSSLNNNPDALDVLMVVDVNDTTGSAEGTSKKVQAQNMISQSKLDVSNADFLAMATTGVKIVGKQGTDKVVIPLSVYVKFTEGGVANTATITPTIGYIDGDSTNYWDQQRFAFDSPTYNGIHWIFAGGNPSVKGVSPTADIADVDLYLYFTTPPTPTATGTLTVWTTYRVLNVA
tara:strand:- start:5358 stop:5906 length:549 start_codon:yes stop_codon:yes gene_type:complete